jgi:hypothetical protein
MNNSNGFRDFTINDGCIKGIKSIDFHYDFYTRVKAIDEYFDRAAPKVSLIIMFNSLIFH